jgi:hypothetical protein
MINCSHCGAKMEKGFQYCPVCGTKADTSVRSDQNTNSGAQDNSPIIQKKPMPLWFKIISLLFVLALIGVTGGILFTEKFVDVVDHHLEALRESDFEKAYTYTSKDFQDSMNYNQFQNFVHSYPVFLNNQLAHFTKRYLKDGHVVLKGNLTSKERVNTPIEYKLVKENDKWKISSIRLTKPDMIPHPDGHATTDDLINLATEMLTLIRKDKVHEAYQDYFSNEFHERTSEKDFVNFVQRYPILRDYETMAFPKATVRNGVGTLGAVLKGEDGETYIKYYFISESNKWKILKMPILSPAEESVEVPMAFGDVILGSERDDQGMIIDSMTVFDSHLQDLYVNLDIENGIKGEVIHLQLQHSESGLGISQEVIVPVNGEAMLSSTFSRPKEGWPKGDYKLLISTASGINQATDFKIE